MNCHNSPAPGIMASLVSTNPSFALLATNENISN